MQLLERSLVRRHGYALVALLAATFAIAITPPAPARHHRTCGHRQPQIPSARQVIDARVVADAQYRDSHFDAAAATLQDAVLDGQFDRELATELLLIASFYEQLGRSYALAIDPDVPLADAVVALQWATRLDAMLGGVHADELAAAQR